MNNEKMKIKVLSQEELLATFGGGYNEPTLVKLWKFVKKVIKELDNFGKPIF